jgi:hypothetical protein
LLPLLVGSQAVKRCSTRRGLAPAFRPKQRSCTKSQTRYSYVSGCGNVCGIEAKREKHPRVRRVITGVGSLWGTVLAIAAAAGIPLAWIWIASRLAGTERDLTPSLAIFIATGILVSYWLALLAGSWIRGRSIDPGEERARINRRSWNRSFSDAPRPDDQRIDPIERLFVGVGVLAIIAFEVWFFFFAGDPLPSQPAF